VATGAGERGAGELQVLPVAGNVHVIIGAGANITVQAGNQGVLLVDTGTAAMSAKVIAAIKSISPKPLRYIVNTTHTAEHVGGNLPVAKTGEIIPFREPDYTAGPAGRAGRAQGVGDFVSERVSPDGGGDGARRRCRKKAGRTTRIRLRRSGCISTTSRW
jgi:glyoxylase-like metal-dependent hydrolase (beta-lactamase superfamily II)